MRALSNRGQHQEFRRGAGQVRLLGQGPLRAVAARGGHYQDPHQEGPQRLVERRGVRTGEELANVHNLKNEGKIFFRF